MEKPKEKLKNYSKIISVIAKVAWIIAIICTGAIAILGTFTAFIFSKIEVDDNHNLEIYGETIDFSLYKATMPEDQLEIYDAALDYIADFLEDHTSKQIFIMAESAVLIAVVELILLIIILFNLDKLFANIAAKESPFVRENAHKIRYICFLILILGFIDWIGATFMTHLWQFNFKSSMSIKLLFVLFIIYTISHIFDYGADLEISLMKKAKKSLEEK